MNIKEYKDKVYGCWLGKNIGGTLGTPFEGKRGTFDIDFYTQDMSGGALPNDDLDLQLIWLTAAEQYGRNVDSAILGDYWMTYIVANWDEYGAGKNNMANGLQPPLSGWYRNHNRNSNGAFIRSEIWACLMPGHPELAVEYAYRDAAVDHFGEGIYGEIFTAALESAAFVETDRDKLIDIGLSYIPADCDTARAVNLVRECYQNGLTWKETRKKLLTDVPGVFGIVHADKENIPEPDLPIGQPGYNVPSNIGLMVLGWLYGENDFGKSICIAAGCGEDGDCTTATLGSILGIIHGAEALPKKWIEPIGDGIKTVSLNVAMPSLKVPTTVTELTDRVCSLMPVFMRGFYDVSEGSVEMCAPEALACKNRYRATYVPEHFTDRFRGDVPRLEYETMFLRTQLTCADGVDIAEDTPIRFDLTFINKLPHQQWLTVKLFAPKEWECNAGREFMVNLDQTDAGFGNETVELELIPHELTAAKTEILFEITSANKVSKIFVPISLLRAPQNNRKIINRL